MLRLILVSVLVVACGGKPSEPGDAGGGGGSGGGGGGVTVEDSGVPFDAGSTDAGVTDSGTPYVDAGTPHIALRTPCVDALATVQAATSDGGVLGERIACSVDQQLADVDTFILSYRTTRTGNRPGASTSRVFLPKVPRAAPAALVVIGHPSVGIADNCATSREMRGVFDMAMPWVMKGYPVIAPDYAGLGNPGTHAYVDNHDLAYSMLDGARALVAMLEPGAHDGRIVMVGYSEGGGAVLASQALARTYGTAGSIVAAVAYAPQYFVRLNSFGYVTMLRNPSALTVAQGYTKPVVAALRQYGYWENRVAEGRGGEAFPAASRMGTVDAINQQCIIGLGAFLPSTRTHVSDLVEDSLRTSFLACVDAPASAGCVEPGRSYHAALEADLLQNDPGGGPVLYVQGMLDTVMPVGEEAACVVPALRNAGVDLTLCTDNVAAHNNIIEKTGDLGVRWAESKLEGTAAPSCSAAMLPSCPP